MLRNLSFYPIFGLPLLIYIGIIGFIFLIIAAYLGYLMFTGKSKVSVKTHKIIAGIGIVIAFIHGTLAVMSYI